ncbi:hypothetical protein GH714_037242 [Hevea brasiliensis]|uniref:Retrotransposon gag domain-containing protein n=1 Tax=Hevea brasiliensis TaxID=3981 RepID=A0A6A6LT62_HEVBR|nr:hypothetical protein GH714_037242 [Hevea brasiliensis]
MADQGNQEQAAGPSVVEEQTGHGRRKGQTRPRDPSRARDELGDMEARLDKIKNHLMTGDDKFEDLDKRLVELGEGLDDTRTELQAAINVTLERLTSENEALKISHAEELSAIQEENRLLKEEVEKIKDEFVLLKRLVAQGGGTNPTLTPSSARVDVPKPGVQEDSRKVNNAPLFLAESAMVWWHQRMLDMEKGTCCIKTWKKFKRELKKQFYPENAADEARAKLRRLTQRSTIREYVKEFSEVLLEIPEYLDQELLFFFKDGLQAWVRLEIERRGAPNLVTTITIAESLVEYKRNDKAKNKDGKSKSGGEKSGSKEGSKDGPKEGNGGKKPWN